MKRKRNRIDSSSLDLFLDTICNAFGGIMFLALVVAIQISIRGDVKIRKETEPQIDTSMPTPSSESLHIARTQLEQAIVIQEDRIQATSDPEIRDLQTKVSNLEQFLSEENEKYASMKRMLDAFSAQQEESEQRMKELDERLVNAKQGLQSTEKGVEATVESKATKLELPRVRSSNKIAIFFAMRYGKLYLVLDPKTRDEFVQHVTLKPVDQALLVTVKLAEGWRLSRPEDQLELIHRLTQVEASSYLVSVAVWPDSYGEFKKFRELLIQRNFDYSLLPFSKDDQMVIMTGSGSKPVQ
jgi:hypothetical protein